MASREEAQQAEMTAARYITQRETGPWSEQQARALEEWLGRSTLHRVVYFRLNAAWQEAGRLKALRGAPPPGVQPVRSARPTAFHWALAAGVLIALIGALSWYRYFDGRNTYTTAIGALQTIPLADGSRVILNTNSRLHVSFDARERLIRLEQGEAFFAVAHDTARPFVVVAGDRRVVAVGTEFSVRREESGELRVLVSDGTVAVTQSDAAGSARAVFNEASAVNTGSSGLSRAHAVLLVAGSEARSGGSSVLVRHHSRTEVEQSLTWRTGILTFHETALADAVAELNRYNQLKIVIRDPAVAALQVGGIFGATQPEQFVRLLEQAFRLHASRQGSEILLTALP